MSPKIVRRQVDEIEGLVGLDHVCVVEVLPGGSGSDGEQVPVLTGSAVSLALSLQVSPHGPEKTSKVFCVFGPMYVVLSRSTGELPVDVEAIEVVGIEEAHGRAGKSPARRVPEGCV
jgi:hypothetical protein